jgi:tetratricopeptide (TPR) repeat protein
MQMRKNMLLVLGLATLCAGGVIAAQHSPRLVAVADASLEPIEMQLSADPDNLRLGNSYRQAIIKIGAYDRGLQFFASLTKAHPLAANLELNYGFAYVDKIPVAGSITQVILANTALSHFTRAVEIAPSWIGYYTRGTSYLFWPRIFNRAASGVADLDEALRIQRLGPKRPYYARAFVALGDGYLKLDDPARARATWREGHEQYQGHAGLVSRLSPDSDAVTASIEAAFDPTKRVDTDLSELWESQ